MGQSLNIRKRTLFNLPMRLVLPKPSQYQLLSLAHLLSRWQPCHGETSFEPKKLLRVLVVRPDELHDAKNDLRDPYRQGKTSFDVVCTASEVTLLTKFG